MDDSWLIIFILLLIMFVIIPYYNPHDCSCESEMLVVIRDNRTFLDCGFSNLSFEGSMENLDMTYESIK